MLDLLSPARLLTVRRFTYTLLLSAGLTAIAGAMLSDSTHLLEGPAAPVAVETGRTGKVTRAVTKGNAMDGFGTWSPDGKQIAFMRSGQIWVVELGGKEPKPLTTSNDAWDAVPAWRPDGKQVAFVRLGAQGDKAQVMLLDPATGKTQQIAAEGEPVGHLAWDSTGAMLYYTTPQKLIQVEAAGGKKRQVLTVDAEWEILAGGLAISKDGKQVVFGAGPRVGRGVQYDLWMASVAGGSQEPKRLTSGGGIMPHFDLNGNRLVYRNPRQSTGIYLMDLTKHQTRKIIPDEPRAMFFHPAFSPDGKSVLVSRLDMEASPAPEGRAQFTSHLHLHTLSASGGD